MRDQRSDSPMPAQSRAGNRMSPGERALRARAAAYAMHAKHGSTKAAISGQAALLARFEHEVDPERQLPPEERRHRAKQLRRSHMTKLALASSRARRSGKAGRDAQ